jgi:drug/metabolite transporter (DMT)-like permease
MGIETVKGSQIGLRHGLSLLLAVVAISFAALFFRLAESTHPLVAAAVRLAISAVFLLPFVLRAGRQGRLDKPMVKAAFLGGVFYAVHFGAWVSSLTMTTVAASVTLVTATPLLLALIGLVTGKDRPDGRLWQSLLVACVGIGIIGWESLERGALMGNLLALVGAGGMAFYLLVARGQGERLDPWAFTGIATAVGAFILCGVSVATGVSLEVPNQSALFFLFLAALVPQLVGHTLLTWSLKRVSPVIVGTATLGEPVGASFLAWIWLGEAVGPWVVVGCLVTLSGVGLAVWRGSTSKEK